MTAASPNACPNSPLSKWPRDDGKQQIQKRRNDAASDDGRHGTRGSRLPSTTRTWHVSSCRIPARGRPTEFRVHFPCNLGRGLRCNPVQSAARPVPRAVQGGGRVRAARCSAHDADRPGHASSLDSAGTCRAIVTDGCSGVRPTSRAVAALRTPSSIGARQGAHHATPYVARDPARHHTPGSRKPCGHRPPDPARRQSPSPAWNCCQLHEYVPEEVSAQAGGLTNYGAKTRSVLTSRRTRLLSVGRGCCVGHAGGQRRFSRRWSGSLHHGGLAVS